jgi:oligogalacturonide lyase
VIHPQFHPLDPDWIEFAGDPAPRMHRVRRDGTGLECLYQHGNDEFLVHETFLGDTGDLVFTVWPYSLKRMDWTTREIRTIVDYNAWHIAPDRRGQRILCDTNHPDEGLQIIDAATGARRQLCLSESSNQGTQWRTSRYALAEDFARARNELSWMEAAADTVYGPQWTHPHPSWSTDETKVAFASDRTGTTQVYVVEV